MAAPVATKNGRVEQLIDVESEGIGVRVLVAGAWGFACDRRLSADGAREAALRACAFAKAAGGRSKRALAPVEAQHGTYRTELDRDPFSVSLADKVALCLRADEALDGADIIVRQAAVRALREHKLLFSSEGTDVEQETIECGGPRARLAQEHRCLAKIRGPCRASGLREDVEWPRYHLASGSADRRAR